MTFDRNGRDWLTAFASGADAVLTKPFTRARLGRVLFDLLVSSASRRCKIVQILPPLRAANERAKAQIPGDAAPVMASLIWTCAAQLSRAQASTAA